jgi:hypothetical protein
MTRAKGRNAQPGGGDHADRPRDVGGRGNARNWWLIGPQAEDSHDERQQELFDAAATRKTDGA